MEKLGDAQADVLVIYAQGSAAGIATRSHAYARYLTDWDSGIYPSAIVLVPDAKPTVFVPNIFLEQFGRHYAPDLEVRFVKPNVFADEVARQVLANARAGGKIAYIGRAETPQPFWERVRATWHGHELVDFEAGVDCLRVVRSDAEIDTHREAARICDGLFDSAFRSARSGKPVFQIRADLQCQALHAGCDYASTWLTSRPAADYSRSLLAETRNVPQTGDQYLVGLMVLFEGCWGHGIRMANLGAPTRAQQQAYDAVSAMHQAMLEQMKPGVEIGTLQAAAKAIREQRYPQIDTFEFRYGHALGYAYDDPLPQGAMPFPQRYENEPSYRGEVRLERNQLFELHPNVFVPDLAGAALGDMALVTNDGYELLTRFPRELGVL
ncbi:peptidase (plasmid) [Caballeronia insecticola]|uniref:Peptidase n=1 Tax=Caballeronia insecticola TaxID=758793 RepID=R4X5H6_9BURK|nr:peptidase [Caballeronia insecticola]